MKTFINWMKTFTLLGFMLFLHLSASAQCYNDLKKEGDRYNRQAIYEEAITQYLAALLCPDLEQDQRVELIKLIKVSPEKGGHFQVIHLTEYPVSPRH